MFFGLNEKRFVFNPNNNIRNTKQGIRIELILIIPLMFLLKVIRARRQIKKAP